SLEALVTVKLDALAPEPAVLVTLITPVVAPLGTVAVIWPSLLTTYEAEVPLKVTAVAEVKPEPVMVTESPGGPKLGEKPLTLGAATYVNEPVDVLPPGLVMPTDTVPAVC